MDRARVEREIEVELVSSPELKVKLLDVGSGAELEELTIRPGQTISARVVIDRADVQGPVSFGGDDSEGIFHMVPSSTTSA